MSDIREHGLINASEVLRSHARVGPHFPSDRLSLLRISVHRVFYADYDTWIYEFKVVGVTGQLSEIYVDATSAEILKREEH